jgi:hypothetical protein
VVRSLISFPFATEFLGRVEEGPVEEYKRGMAGRQKCKKEKTFYDDFKK